MHLIVYNMFTFTASIVLWNISGVFYKEIFLL